jgi:hypothetical protein
VVVGVPCLVDAGPKDPGCENLTICAASKFLCVAEASSKDKLNQTFQQVRDALEDVLKAYDSAAKPAGGPLSPLAPLTKCD